jgi:hypothetical protein
MLAIAKLKTQLNPKKVSSLAICPAVGMTCICSEHTHKKTAACNKGVRNWLKC